MKRKNSYLVVYVASKKTNTEIFGKDFKFTNQITGSINITSSKPLSFNDLSEVKQVIMKANNNELFEIVITNIVKLRRDKE